MMGIVDRVMQQATPGERIGVAVRDVAGGGRLAISLSGSYILELLDSEEVIINGCWRGLKVPGLVEEGADALFHRMPRR